MKNCLKILKFFFNSIVIFFSWMIVTLPKKCRRTICKILHSFQFFFLFLKWKTCQTNVGIFPCHETVSNSTKRCWSTWCDWSWRRFFTFLGFFFKKQTLSTFSGQFFPDIVEWCDEQAQKHGKIVVISALDGDFQRNPFGKVLQVGRRALSVCVTVCFGCTAHSTSGTCDQIACCMYDVWRWCSVHSAFNCGRRGNPHLGFCFSMLIFNKVEVIGGADKYVAVCRPCHSRQAQIKSIPKVLCFSPQNHCLFIARHRSPNCLNEWTRPKKRLVSKSRRRKPQTRKRFRRVTIDVLQSERAFSCNVCEWQ